TSATSPVSFDRSSLVVRPAFGATKVSRSGCPVLDIRPAIVALGHTRPGNHPAGAPPHTTTQLAAPDPRKPEPSAARTQGGLAPAAGPARPTTPTVAARHQARGHRDRRDVVQGHRRAADHPAARLSHPGPRLRIRLPLRSTDPF